LSIRVNEHRSHIRRNSTQPSVITNHRLNFKHEFDWDNARVLDNETNYNKRLISEMIYMKKQKQGLNAQTDTDLLDPIYNDLFSSILWHRFPFYYLFTVVWHHVRWTLFIHSYFVSCRNDTVFYYIDFCTY